MNASMVGHVELSVHWCCAWPTGHSPWLAKQPAVGVIKMVQKPTPSAESHEFTIFAVLLEYYLAVVVHSADAI